MGKIDIGCLPHLNLYGARACGDELRRRVLGENNDTVSIEVAVRVSGSPDVVTGMLLDSSTMVPIRKFASAVKGLEVIQTHQNKEVELKFNGKVFKEAMLNVNGVGFVTLSSVCEKIGWTTKVEKWTKDKRIVVARPKAPVDTNK